MRKILNNLRTWLIHKLGGLTIEESKDSDYASHDIGYFVACIEHISYADHIYGLPAEEWCEKMYKQLKHDFDRMASHE